MKTGDKEEEKKVEEKAEEKNDGSKELVAGADYGSDTAGSDADSNPYAEHPAAGAEEKAESAPGASVEPAQTAEGGPSAEKQDFHYSPPERID